MFEFINAHDLPTEFKVATPFKVDSKEVTVKRADANNNSAKLDKRKTVQFDKKVSQFQK